MADLNSDLEAVATIFIKIRELNGELIQKDNLIEERDLMLIAAYLHHFYTGLESIFERIADNMDGGIVKRGDYHRELLRSMSLQIDEVRPRVIFPALAEELDDYRKFRDLFRHAYAGELRWKKMNYLATNVSKIYPALEISLKEFIDFIKKLASQL
jgi:uncharacterized protein YutE (UPF0331/DUF86 family)